MAREKADLSAKLLNWYDAHRRDLPWRAKPHEVADPYRVWLSEIMLQQTNVTTVKPYFAAFLKRWPTVKALAAAPREEVMQAWAGLGYYARARNLHACAIHVAEKLGGIFPTTCDGLLELPGIGPYTAGAISAIAYDERQAAVDGNVERVITRAFALETPLPDVKPQVREITQSLVPEKRAGDFAQAMMDLGSGICTPKNPDCRLCPWELSCKAKKLGIAETLPRRKEKPKVPQRQGIAWWIERADGALLLRRRPDKGLLGGMLEMPSSGWAETAKLKRTLGSSPRVTVETDADTSSSSGLTRGSFSPSLSDLFGGADTGLRVTHTFTHFHLELAIWSAAPPKKLPGPDYHWAKRESLANEALPSVMRKAVAAALGADVLKKKKP